MDQVNEYQAAARLKKCQALTNALVAGKITSDLARTMDEDEWKDIAQRLELKSAPSQTTRDMVIEQLEQMERIAGGGA